MESTLSYADEYLNAVEQELDSVVRAPLLPSSGPLDTDLQNIFKYHLGWSDAQGRTVAADSGKRLRPLICLLSCEAAGGNPSEDGGPNWRVALPAAAAIELVHNFSLIHDDIQDNSEERRGRAAVWKIWGIAQGINAGDAMFVLARLALDRLEERVPPATYADVHRIFDSATLALTQGQFLDLCFEHRANVTVEEYLEMVQGKTAALLAAAARIGARIATDNLRVVEAFAGFGANLGVAFQIVDDILGIWGDPAVTGKSARDDILVKKKSFPLLAAAQADASGGIAAYFSRHEMTLAEVDRIRAVLNGLNARKYAEAKAEEYMESALLALDRTGLSNAALERLRGLARRAVRREK